jgi:hypothetical protein
MSERPPGLPRGTEANEHRQEEEGGEGVGYTMSKQSGPCLVAPRRMSTGRRRKGAKAWNTNRKNTRKLSNISVKKYQYMPGVRDWWIVLQCSTSYDTNSLSSRNEGST